jgi:glycosyltransferase involved in cell wall biosynthesis
MLRNKKICLITNRYPGHPDDVASPFVRDFHLGLKAKGWKVSVFTPFYQTERIEYSRDVVRFRWRGGEKVVGSLSFFDPKELLDLFSFLKDGRFQLLQHLREIRPDHCLALWALPSGWFAYQAKKELGIPYSVWCLGSDIYVWAEKPILRTVTRKVLQEADCLFADGFDLKERVQKLTGKSCLFLPSMRKLPPASEEKTQIDPRKFNFLYLGRWDKSKGLEDLIRAFAQVSDEIASAHLFILGWGSLEKRMKRLIRELRLEKQVKLVGKVSTKLVASYIRQADCVTIPSKSDSIPLVFSEALQMGTPLVVTNVGDMGYLVKRFRLGKVVPPGAVNKLARAMIQFAGEKADYSMNIPEALRLLDVERAVEGYLRTVAQEECHPAPVTSSPAC